MPSLPVYTLYMPCIRLFEPTVYTPVVSTWTGMALRPCLTLFNTCKAKCLSNHGTISIRVYMTGICRVYVPPCTIPCTYTTPGTPRHPAHGPVYTAGTRRCTPDRNGALGSRGLCTIWPGDLAQVNTQPSMNLRLFSGGPY